MLRLSEFNYYLPKHLIAQEPSEKRDHSRLLVLSHDSGQIEHHYFYEVTDYLQSGDVLVLNNTKVLPAKLIGRRQTGGLIELLLLREVSPARWEILLNSRGKIKSEEMISFRETNLLGKLSRQNQQWLIDFGEEDIRSFLQEKGKSPLPPYIKRPKQENNLAVLDKERYQTVYAMKEGAIAAPTAGLHFTRELLDKIAGKGVKIVYLTLHIGRGTFEPIRTDDVTKHRMEQEYFEVPEETMSTLVEARKNHQRIIAVGTTVCRTLETLAKEITSGINTTQRDRTDLFIYPPYQFQIVNGLITNFHLPQGTPLLLTCAFAGRERILAAYQEAIKLGYRFYSYGDAMLIQ